MTIKIKPYLEKSVQCPLCRSVAEHPEVKARLYVERDRDVDLKPKTYLWAVKEFEVYYPPLYYMWACPYCKFTAAASHYLDPANSNGMLGSQFSSAFASGAERPDYNKVIEDLYVPYEEDTPRTFEAGLSHHLLSIYILHGLKEIVERESIILGKYYLRTAWLFRDLAGSYSLHRPSCNKLIFSLRKFWPDIPCSEQTCLERSAHYLEQALGTSSSLETRRDEIELILLIARIWMKAGDTRKAKNFGAYSRDLLEKYESEIAKAEIVKTPEVESEILRLRLSQSAVLNILHDLKLQ